MSIYGTVNSILAKLSKKYNCEFYRTKVVNGISQHFESVQVGDTQYTGYIGLTMGEYKLLFLKRLDLNWGGVINETIIFEAGA